MSTGGPRVAPLTREALRAFMSRSEIPMVLTDDQLRYLEVNDAACRFAGRSREELLGLEIGDMTAAGDQSAVAARTEAFFEDGNQSGRAQVIGAGGQVREVEFSSIANVLPGVHLSLIVPVEAPPDGARDHPDGVSSKDGEALTKRERQVLAALAGGRTGAEIASDLVISPETVRNHVRNARAKLGARTRAEAVVRALQRGEIALDRAR